MTQEERQALLDKIGSRARDPIMHIFYGEKSWEIQCIEDQQRWEMEDALTAEYLPGEID